jgi:hypothetical protein
MTKEEHVKVSGFLRRPAIRATVVAGMDKALVTTLQHRMEGKIGQVNCWRFLGLLVQEQTSSIESFLEELEAEDWTSLTVAFLYVALIGCCIQLFVLLLNAALTTPSNSVLYCSSCQLYGGA